MAKRKVNKYKLQKTRTYSPIIAVLGVKKHPDYMPLDCGTKVKTESSKVKTTEAASRIRYKRSIFTKN